MRVDYRAETEIKLFRVIEVLENITEKKFLREGHWDCGKFAQAIKDELLSNRDPVNDANDNVSHHLVSILDECALFVSALKTNFWSEPKFTRSLKIQG